MWSTDKIIILKSSDENLCRETMSSTNKIITLKSLDGESFEVKEAMALQFGTIHQMIEIDNPDKGIPLEIDIPAEGIPLPNVTGRILSKVIKYCKKHVDNTNRDSSITGDDLKAWDAEFIKVDQATLFDLILAANYLNIKGLLDLTCQTVANMIKAKTPENVRKTFCINDELTSDEEEEEEEEIRRENQWAFD